MDTVTQIPFLDGWIPIRLYWQEGQPIVDWCYLGPKSFTDPFFNQTVEGCLRYPFNLLFRHQTRIEVLGQWHEDRPGLSPGGFIFHMSRCGSTLITRMLAALPRNIVISEAGPIDSVLRANFHCPAVTDDQQIAWLRWMMSALAQQRLGEEKHFFIKFDAWNTLELPLIRRAFPAVPWIFVYRDPVEVLVSQLGHRGAHMVPGVIDPRLFGMNADTISEMEPEEYCARVLATICEAALRHHANGGMLVNYRQLPQAVWSSLSEFLGVHYAEAEKETMKAVARLHAKNPVEPFRDDSAKKQQRATPQVRDAAKKWLYPIYEQLEATRLGATSTTTG